MGPAYVSLWFVYLGFGFSEIVPAQNPIRSRERWENASLTLK